ncbi:hypothetical protein PO909_009977 [Leuciscus waleckii]
MYPDAAFIILGDFNHCNLRKSIPKLYQFVTFPTRGKNILDQCYSNIKNAYTAEPEPHFGKADHLAILLKPTYIRRLSDPVTKKVVNIWTESALMNLQGCLEATDMNVFKDASEDIHDYTETVSYYINWCTSICVPSRTVRIFPNQKRWFNGDIRLKIKQRQVAFKAGNGEEYKKARYDLRKRVKVAKKAYSQKLESHYMQNDTRSMWQGIQSVTNYNKRSTNRMEIKDATLPDCLNNFYARFDRLNGDTPSKLGLNTEECALHVTQEQVRKVFGQLNPRKAVGPDGVSPKVLKVCGEQLAGVYTDIFNLSLTHGVVPRLFKSSIIIPVPKKANTSTLNDFRPVALTSVPMKCLEKLVLRHINSVVPDTVDPLQFAYRPNRSVDDAVAMTLHFTLQHLDRTGTYVRMLFLDYSSAFNTIRPGKLIVKLADLGVPSTTCNWVLDFLSDRPQKVRMGGNISTELTLSTGTPQGCCLSPKLFTLYTHDCVTNQNNTAIIKYADDTTVLGLIKGGMRLVTGLKKAQQRLYFIRLLRKAGLSRKPLIRAYRGLVESILTNGITVWFGSTTQAERRALQRVIKTAQRIIGSDLPSMDALYTQRCRKRAKNILRDTNHPGHLMFKPKHSVYNLRYGRPDSIISHRVRFYNSFFPATVRLMAKDITGETCVSLC